MNFLFRQVDISSLIFFRIAFGILGFADVLGIWIYAHFTKTSFNPEGFQFRYYGFEWVRPVSEPWMSLIFIIILISSLGIVVGKWYRWSATIFAIGFTYLYFLEKAYYLNHGYLTCVLSFVMILLPVHRSFSLDVLRKPLSYLKQIPYWNLFVLQFMMGVVYFFGGIAKLNSDWLNGLPLKIWLKQKADMPVLGWLWGQEFTAYFMSYSGMLLDLLVVFFLLSKRTRIFALCFVMFFHLVNLILFKIGIFPFLSVCLTLLYFPPDLPRRWIYYLGKKLSIVQSWIQGWKRVLESRKAQTTEISYSDFQKKAITCSLILFCTIHVLLPLRHHLFAGNVAWTEEGHRYSWRMMLRSKQGYGHFTVIADGEKFRINPRDYLDSRQKRKLFTHPDMILQFAHHLRDEYLEEGYKNVKVYAFIRAKLNGRPYQLYIDPERDLAKEKWQHFKHSDWIVPFTEN